ncbi:MAG: hypothetical protein GY757_24075, partial [bacterium]|nr:hypothetical protein [bacterium]
LGGHSLKGTVLLTRISQELNVDLPLAEVFKTPTIEGLANIIIAMDWVNTDTGAPVDDEESEEVIL